MEDDQNGRRPKWKKTKMEFADARKNGLKLNQRSELDLDIDWDNATLT